MEEPKPPTFRSPASIRDTRFAKRRQLRKARCAQCDELKGGNAFAFCHRQNMPPAGEGKVAWERGDWDAIWYCTECYMKLYFDDLPDDYSKHKAVCEMLGLTGRAAKKARHATAARW